MVRPVIFALAGLFLVSVYPCKAYGGAWTQPKNDALVISTIGLHRLDAPGSPASLRKEEYAVYFEYGLLERLTVIGRFGAQNLLENRVVEERLANGNLAEYTREHVTGVGGIELGARYHLTRYHDWVIAGQAVIGVPGAGENSTNLRFGEGGGDVDIRVEAGRAWLTHGFISTAAGWRNRRGLNSNEWRFDLAAGYRFENRMEAHIQTYSMWSEPGGLDGLSAYQGHRAQASIVYPISRRAKIQLGALGTIHADNIASERALIIGLWRKF